MPYKPKWKMEYYDKHDNQIALEAQRNLMRYLNRERLISIEGTMMIEIPKNIWNKIFEDMGFKSICDMDDSLFQHNSRVIDELDIREDGEK
jgi:hypothetical protein